MEIKAFHTPGLGDTTYLVTHEDTGVLVDPQRDAERFLEAAEAAGVPVRYVLETHLHNDYVSGGYEAAHRARAKLVLPAAAGAAFDHVPAFHLEDLEVGDGLIIRPIHTPGHTPEHVSYLVLMNGQAVGLFSGGSLLAGSAGRTDLHGLPRARQLAILQHGSLRRLASLPDDVVVYPTHGAGSFCSASTSGQGSSTIGNEKAHNPALLERDPAAFARVQLEGLQPYPRYYAHMGPINLLGPTPLPTNEPPTLTAPDLVGLGDQVAVLDGRPREEFAAGHIPGSISIELGEQFGVWTGWLLPFNTPLVLVLAEGQDLDQAVVQLTRIGFDNVRGVIRELAEWSANGRPLSQFETVAPEQFADAIARGHVDQILDVRSPAEWETGHIERSVHRYVPDLVTLAPAEFSPEKPVWVACAGGYRATIAAGLLERAGFRPVVLSSGGVPDVLNLLSSESIVA